MQKEKYTWTQQIGGQAALEDKEYAEAERMLPGRSRSREFYITARRLRQEGQDEAFPVDSGNYKAASIWDALEIAFQNGDLSGPNARRLSNMSSPLHMFFGLRFTSTPEDPKLSLIA